MLPRVRRQRRNRPKWYEEVIPYKDDYIWWHNQWITSGRPTEGIVYEYMRDSKRQLAYANRRNNRKERQTRMEKMAEAISVNRTRDFFKEVKKLDPKDNRPSSVDGHVELKEIADLFADKYDLLYNSVPSDAKDIEQIAGQIKSGCVQSPRDQL